MLTQSKDQALRPSVHPHILRILELSGTGVVVLQGSDGATITHKVSQLAHFSIPVSDPRAYPKKYKRQTRPIVRYVGQGGILHL